MLDKPDNSEKFRHPNLKVLARGMSCELVGVLIELDLPVATIETRPIFRRGAVIQRPLRVQVESDADDAASAKKIVDARQFLESVLGTAPTWLPGAATFVARATPEQLRRIAESDFVKAIWLNQSFDFGASTRAIG